MKGSPLRGIVHEGTCAETGKRQFSSKADAKTAARRIESAGTGVKVGRVGPYRCGDHWHVGHDPIHHHREAS